MGPAYAKDNKERVPFEHYLAEFKDADPQEMSLRTGTRWSEETSTFTVSFLGVEYSVSFPDFMIDLTDGTEMPPVLETMSAAKTLVIRFLLEGCKAAGTGNFLTYREVPWGEVYYRQFSGRCLSRLAFSYGNRMEVFRSVMEKLGANDIHTGDAGYEMEVFDGFFVRFLLWGGDEEFPPSAQILFSDNFAAAFHAEDLVVTCDVILGAMKEAQKEIL